MKKIKNKWQIQNIIYYLIKWADLQTSTVYKICLFILSFFYTTARRLLLLSQQHRIYDYVRSWKSSEQVKYEKS